MASSLDYFNSYVEGKEPILSLSDENAGKLYKAKYLFFFDDIEPDFPVGSQIKTVWDYEFSKLKRDKHTVYVRSLDAKYKVYLRDIADDRPMNREGWYIAQKNSPLQQQYPDKAFDLVTVDDMRELDAKSLRRSSKKSLKPDGFEVFEEIY